MADQSIIDAITEGFRQVMKLTGGNSVGSGNATGGNSKPFQDSGAIDKLMKAADNTGQALGPLYFGFIKLTTGVDATTTALTGMKDFASKFPVLGGMTGQAIEALVKSRDDLNKAMSEAGVGNNDLGRFIRMSGEAGLTTKEFADFAKTGGQAIAGLSSSANKNAEAFSKVQKELINNPAGQELMRAGVGAKELAEYTALSVAMGRNRDVSTQRGQQQLATSVALLGREIDNTARMTGQSREEIAKDLKARAQSADGIMSMQDLDEEQQENMKEFNASASKLGPAMQDLLQENLTKGAVTSEKGRALLTMYGTAGEELLQAQQAALNARTPADKAAAQAQLDKAQADVMAFQASRDFAKNYKSMTDDQRAVVGPTIVAQNAFAQNLKKAAQETGSYEAGMAKMKDEASKGRLGLKEDGTRDEGQELNRGLNEANIRSTISMGALAGKVEEVNLAFGKSPEAINAFNKALGYVGAANENMEGRKQSFNKTPEKVTSIVSNMLTGTDTPPTASPSNDKNMQKTPEGRYKPAPKKEDGGVVPGTDSGTTITVGEKGKPEAILPLDKLQTMMGGITTQISSATTPAGGSSVSALDNKQYLEQWKKNYEEQTVVMIGTEKQQAQQDIQYAQERINSKSAKIKELEDIKATRELTEDEQRQLRLSQRGKARAEQNLASDQARLSVLELIDKSGLANQANMAEKFIAGQADTKEAQETAMKLTTEGASEILKINGKIMDPSGPEAKEVMAKMSVSKAEIDKVMADTMGIKASAPSDSKASVTATGGLGGYDMFNPVIKDQQAADEQKAKRAAQKADLVKKEAAEKSDADAFDRLTVKPKTENKQAESTASPARAAETTLKDLNDQLIALNKQMVQLINHNAEIVDHTKTSARKEPAGYRKGL